MIGVQDEMRSRSVSNIGGTARDKCVHYQQDYFEGD
jgi:hypothetical protein